MTPARTAIDPGRMIRGLGRRVRDAVRGETAATFFDPFSRRELTGLLGEFGIPVPTADPQQASDGVAGAGRFVLGLWLARPDLRRRFPKGLSDPDSGFPHFVRESGVGSVSGEWSARSASGSTSAPPTSQSPPGHEPSPVASFWWDRRPAGLFRTTGGTPVPPNPNTHPLAERADHSHPNTHPLAERADHPPKPDHVDELFASRPFDRVRQVYELRADVRDALPLALTPAQRGEYAAWLFRYGRSEYGLEDHEILWYLFGLTEDPACGLGDAYLLTPGWQRAVPDALTATGWDNLKRWLARTYPDRVGRWLRLARRPDRFADNANADRSAVNLLGHFKYDSGLQEVSLGQAAAFRAAGRRTFLRDIPIAYPRDWRDAGRYIDPERGPVTVVTIGANDPLDEAYRRAGLHPRPGVYRIVYWAWELEQFPRRAVERAGLANEVWTLSEFCARAIRAAMPDRPVLAMPPAVVTPTFDPRPRSHFGLPADRFLFLFLFDMASGMERKNPLGLIRAFRQAFRPKEPAHLAIKVSRGHADPTGFAALRRAADAAGVTLIDRVMPRPDVAALLAGCDAYVSLHRSEGFGFTMAEAMLLGKPTVATGYSGNLDFMTTDNSFLVRSDRVALDRDHPPYPKGCVWADPSVDHAAELMRRVFDDRAGSAAIAARGRETVADFLSQEATAARMTARLAEVRTV